MVEGDSGLLAETFRDDAVRALAWSVLSPNLMDDVPDMTFVATEDVLYSETLSWLKSLDDDPTRLHEHLATEASWKVGVRFEALLAFWLRWRPDCALLGHNLQVRDGGRTLGAFDFIMRCQDGRVEHWEVAVKFYLQRRDSDDWSAWVGPNQRDRLDIKLERMRGHQLPLSSLRESQDILRSAGVLDVPVQRGVLKGAFFSPWDRAARGPQGSRSATPRGRWVEAHRLEDYGAQVPGCRWTQREKPNWLGPSRCDQGLPMTTDEWIAKTNARDVGRPELWSGLRRNEAGLWLEEHTLFLLPSGWEN